MNGRIINDFTVPADHPSLAGHFPGQPVVPAVVLLDAVLAEIQARSNLVLQSIPAAKFLQPVLPEQRIELRIEFTSMEPARWRAHFKGVRASLVAFEGSFIVAGSDSAP